MASHSVPQCVGFIMDGNRRWAAAQGADHLLGHNAGYNVFKDVVRWLSEVGIAHGVFYAFSTENWQRGEVEVGHLLALFEGALRENKGKSDDELRDGSMPEARYRFIGRRTDFSPELQSLMAELESRTAHVASLTVWIALSYGGRAELVEAVNAAVTAGAEVTEETFRQYLWSAELPDVDLLIRTSGEQRISNFLPWQLSYSEFSFTPTPWPAFTKDEFTRMLEDYASRQRRHGT